MRPSRRLDLDHRLQPVEPARAGAHDLDLEAARRPRPRPAPRRPRRRRPRRAPASRGNVRRAALIARASVEQRVEPCRRRGARRHARRASPPAPPRRGRGSRPASSVTRAVGAWSRRSRCPGAASACAASASPPRGLAGLGAAELEDVPAGRLAAEVVVEGDDAVHLGARQVQRVGDQRLGFAVDVAERACSACRIGSRAPGAACRSVMRARAVSGFQGEKDLARSMVWSGIPANLAQTPEALRPRE